MNFEKIYYSKQLKIMKKITLLLSLFVFNFCFSQVGIGTTTPEGALDIRNTTQGLLPPRVILTATNIASPVTNPNGGSLPAGTLVYNTNSTVGNYAVYPGIYYWDGNNWVATFKRAFRREFTQSAILRANTLAGYENLPGLNNVSFIAPEDGVYQIIAHTYYGVEECINNDLENEVGWGEGIFRLNINGTDYFKYIHSESYYNFDNGQEMFLLYNEGTIISYIQLTAGQTCNLTLSFDQSATDNLKINNTGVVGNDPGFSLSNNCYITSVFIGN